MKKNQLTARQVKRNSPSNGNKRNGGTGKTKNACGFIMENPKQLKSGKSSHVPQPKKRSGTVIPKHVYIPDFGDYDAFWHIDRRNRHMV